MDIRMEFSENGSPVNITYFPDQGLLLATIKDIQAKFKPFADRINLNGGYIMVDFIKSAFENGLAYHAHAIVTDHQLQNEIREALYKE